MGRDEEERREEMEKGGLTLRDDKEDNRKTLNGSSDFLCRYVTLSAAPHPMVSKTRQNKGVSV